MKKYEVTIGIPVFQSVRFIEQAMESALAQTFHSIEFLVIDDCGEDGSMAVIKHLQQTDDRGKDIRILRNNRNLGPGYSRNRIIVEACGRYLFFMDSDDVIEPGTIQLLYDAVCQNRSQIAYASYDIIDKLYNTQRQTCQKPSLVLRGEGELALFAFKNAQVFQITVCNFLIDIDVLRRLGVKFIQTRFWEDMAFTYELVSKISDAVLLSDITYHYYRRAGSLSNYQHRELLDKEEILANISVLEYLKDKSMGYQGRNFLPDMVYNIELNCFYLVCHVLKHNHIIVPQFTARELRDVMKCPFTLREILNFKSHVAPILLFGALAAVPVPLFRRIMMIVGKLKRVS